MMQVNGRANPTLNSIRTEINSPACPA